MSQNIKRRIELVGNTVIMTDYLAGGGFYKISVDDIDIRNEIFEQ